MRKRKSHNLSFALVGGALAALFLAASPAHAQATATSTFTVQVSGNVPAVKTGLPETVSFAGPVVVTSTVVTDPITGSAPATVVQVDGRGVIGTGNKTKTVYLNSLFYPDLTRPFGATDTIEVTFAFFQDAPGSYLQSKTGLLTLSLTYDTTTMSLTNVTGAVGTL